LGIHPRPSLPEEEATARILPSRSALAPTKGSCWHHEWAGSKLEAQPRSAENRSFERAQVIAWIRFSHGTPSGDQILHPPMCVADFPRGRHSPDPPNRPVHEGGLRVVVAATSVALPKPAISKNSWRSRGRPRRKGDSHSVRSQGVGWGSPPPASTSVRRPRRRFASFSGRRRWWPTVSSARRRGARWTESPMRIGPPHGRSDCLLKG
jgi:hypothetical protein